MAAVAAPGLAREVPKATRPTLRPEDVPEDDAASDAAVLPRPAVQSSADLDVDAVLGHGLGRPRGGRKPAFSAPSQRGKLPCRTMRLMISGLLPVCPRRLR